MDTQPKIIGGQDADTGEYPFQVKTHSLLFAINTKRFVHQINFSPLPFISLLYLYFW